MVVSLIMKDWMTSMQPKCAGIFLVHVHAAKWLIDYGNRRQKSGSFLFDLDHLCPKVQNPHQPFRHEYCCELFGARRPGPASFHAVFTWYDVARGYTHATWGET